MNAPSKPGTQQGIVEHSTLLNERPSDAGLRRLHEHRGEPLFVADWRHAVFLHFTVDPAQLQSTVPFPLDLKNGRAWISLVAFTMVGMRPSFGGRLGKAVLRPIATHPFLNVRTYIRRADEPGIHFLAEWLPNKLASLLGPACFGLPYRRGRLEYHHTGKLINGEVVNTGGLRLRYREISEQRKQFAECERGSLDEFLMERYTAYVAWRGGRLGFFRVWHHPWKQTRVELVMDTSTLLEAVPGAPAWLASATFQFANYTPGVTDVAMGRPHLL